MAFKYRVVQRSNPREVDAPNKYYANPVYERDIDLRELTKEIALMSTVSRADVLAVLETMLELIPKHLGTNRIVRLGEFGSFRVGLQTDGAEQEEDFNESYIKKAKMSFRAGSEFNDYLKTLKFEKE